MKILSLIMFFFTAICGYHMSYSQTSPVSQINTPKTETKAIDADTKKTENITKKDETKKTDISTDEAKKTEEEKRKKEEKEKLRQEKLKESDIKKAEWIEKTMKFGVNKDRKDAINFIPTVQDQAKKELLT